MNEVALLGLALAGVVTWKAAAHPGARALALWLGFGLIAWGWGVVVSSGWALPADVALDRHVLGAIIPPIGFGALGVSAVWFARFGALFPRAIAAADVEAYQRVRWEGPGRLSPDDRMEAWVTRRLPAGLRRWIESSRSPRTMLRLINFFRSPAAWLLPLALVCGVAAVRLVSPSPPNAFILALVFATVLLPMAVGANFLSMGYAIAAPSERRQLLWVAWGSLPGVVVLAFAGGFLAPRCLTWVNGAGVCRS